MKRCFQVEKGDNVSTLLDDVDNESVEILGTEEIDSLKVIGAVRMGHKIALREIGAGVPVVKFGVPIGVATRDIQQGEWVHLQNCSSRVDMRSASMDPHSGAATDTRYE